MDVASFFLSTETKANTKYFNMYIFLLPSRGQSLCLKKKKGKQPFFFYDTINQVPFLTYLWTQSHILNFLEYCLHFTLSVSDISCPPHGLSTVGWSFGMWL